MSLFDKLLKEIGVDKKLLKHLDKKEEELIYLESVYLRKVAEDLIIALTRLGPERFKLASDYIRAVLDVFDAISKVWTPDKAIAIDKFSKKLILHNFGLTKEKEEKYKI